MPCLYRYLSSPAERLFPRLLDWIAESSALPPLEALAQLRKMAHQLLVAVAFMHNQGLVNADIKPDNLLLCSPPGGWASLPCWCPAAAVAVAGGPHDGAGGWLPLVSVLLSRKLVCPCKFPGSLLPLSCVASAPLPSSSALPLSYHF